MQIRPTRRRRAEFICAAIVLGSLASEASAQAVVSSGDTTVAAQSEAPVSNSTLNGSLSALQEGGRAQQGVPVPYNRPQAQRHVDVSANGDVTYDTNVIRSNALRVNVAGYDKQDIVLPVGLSVDLFVPSGANTYSLQGVVGYQFYARNTRLNSENIALIGGYGRTIRACHVGIDPSFARSRTQLQEGGFGLLDNNLQTTESVGASLFCNVTAGLRPFASASYLRARNSQGLRTYSDHDTKTVGGGVVNSFPTIGDLGVVASLENTDYPNRTFMQGATQVRVKSVGITFSRETARILQTRVQVNYTSVDDGQVNGSFSGLSGNALVRFVPGARVAFTLTANRSATPSLDFASDYNLDTSYGLAADAKISRKLTADAGYFLEYRKFFGVVALPGLGFTKDTTRTYNARLDYQILTKISLRASFVHTRRTSDNARLNYSDTRSTLGVNFRF